MENLNVCTRHGARPHFFHVVDTVKSLTPSCLASSRLDQCVTPRFCGGASKVANTIRTGSITRGRPGLARSSRPAIPSAAYRFFHAITVGFETPTRSTIWFVPTPSSASSTIRARCANPARNDGARVHRSNSMRSSSGIATSIVNGMAHDPTK